MTEAAYNPPTSISEDSRAKLRSVDSLDSRWSVSTQVDIRPTAEFKEAVQDVLNRRTNMTYSDVLPLSAAIDNELKRRGIIR